MGKNKNNRIGITYSTNPDFEFSQDDYQSETKDPSDQKLKVMIDRKQRRGKSVTLITGFSGTEDDLKDLAKMLKSKCGVGGSAKEGEIIVQGALKQKVYDLLIKDGYSQTKMSGG